MKTAHNRAFKEWAVSCQAMREGEQILLIRKGGIREEEGVFRISDQEFFLMPTWEHQNSRLLKPEYISRLESLQAQGHDPAQIVLDSYAVVTNIYQAKNEKQVQAVAHECPWNQTYIKERFDFNPYDPLYLAVLRVYRLPEPQILPMLPEYGGCKSWVTLEREIDLTGAIPAIPDTEFEARASSVLNTLKEF